MVIRLDQIGDLVMTTPFLRELRRNLPDVWITLIVLPVAFDLVENCPYVNEVLACDWSGDRDLYRFHRHWRALKFAHTHLQYKQFDLAILPRRDTDQAHGAFLAYFSGALLRVGYSDISKFGSTPPYFRNNDRLLTHVVDIQTLKHEVEYGLELINYIGGKVQSDHMEIWLNSEDERFSDHVLKSHDVKPNNLLIGFVPGATSSKRMWPLSRFAAIGEWLINEYNAKILLVGGQKEESLAYELRQKLKRGVVNTVGQTTLRQAAAILKRCQLYVGNDTGLMHIAAATRVPIVEISCHPKHGLSFHPNSPKRFGPWGVIHRILSPKPDTPPCSGTYMPHEEHRIRDVTVAQVKEAIIDILSSQSKSKVYRDIILSC